MADYSNLLYEKITSKLMENTKEHLTSPSRYDLTRCCFRRWYEIMALYYVKPILTEISASRQDRRVLQKSKIIRIEFLSKWGMLQTSRYV